MNEKFTPKAQKLWGKVPAWAQEKILSNVWCGECRGAVKMVDFSGKVVGNDIVLSGMCQVCKSPVTRVVESN
jgi:hypothetical protein